MSTNSADLSTSFSPEEWTLIKSAPLLAGLSVTFADLRSGIFGAIKEGLAPSQAIIEAGQGSSNPVVASVVASIKEMAGEARTAPTPISVSGKKPEELKATEVAAQLAKISGILEGKVPADQAGGIQELARFHCRERSPMRRPREGSLELGMKRSARRKPPRSTNWLLHSA